MTLSACPVCKQARPASPGLVECHNSGFNHPVMHVCFSFVPLWMTESAERYVPVTRTETAKSGRNCTSRTAA